MFWLRYLNIPYYSQNIYICSFPIYFNTLLFVPEEDLFSSTNLSAKPWSFLTENIYNPYIFSENDVKDNVALCFLILYVLGFSSAECEIISVSLYTKIPFFNHWTERIGEIVQNRTVNKALVSFNICVTLEEIIGKSEIKINISKNVQF